MVKCFYQRAGFVFWYGVFVMCKVLWSQYIRYTFKEYSNCVLKLSIMERYDLQYSMLLLKPPLRLGRITY